MLARNLQTLEEDLSVATNFGKKVLANTAGVYAVSMLPDFTNNSTNTVQRNLMRGFAWYLSDEVANELTTMNSNLRNFTDMSTLKTGVVNAVNDSVFYGLASMAIEQTSVDVPIVNTINSFVTNQQLSQNLAIGTLLTGTQLLGQHLEKAGYDVFTDVLGKVGINA